MSEASEGYGPMPAHGEFCWVEIASTDLEKCRLFYSNVFGWEFKRSQAAGEDFPYLEFSSCGTEHPDGALYAMTPKMFGGEPMPPAHIAHYIAVDDCDAAAAKAAGLGAAILKGPEDIPNVGRMAFLTDPSGAMFAMIALGQQGAKQ